MTRRQFSKFSPFTVQVKRRVKDIRKRKGLKLYEAAAELGISRKQMEDVETERSYGCHLELELLAKMAILYQLPLGRLVKVPGETEPTDAFFQRPGANLRR